MINKFSVLLFLLFALPMVTLAQRPKKNIPFDKGTRLRPSGLFFGAGVSGMVELDKGQPQIHRYGLGTSYRTSYSATTPLTVGFQLGYFFAPQRGIFRTIEVGAAFKKRRGLETGIGIRESGADVTFEDVIIGDGQFIQHSVDFTLNPTIVWSLGEKAIFHHGPGMSFEIIRKRREKYSRTILPGNVDETAGDKHFSLTYGAGFGFRASEKAYIVISARASLYAPFSEEYRNGSRQLLNLRYRPYSVFITYNWLKNRKDITCSGYKPRSRKGGRLASSRKTQKHPW